VNAAVPQTTVDVLSMQAHVADLPRYKAVTGELQQRASLTV